MQKKAYKALAAIAEAHPSFVRTNIDDVAAAIVAAAPLCHTACKRKRLVCMHAICLSLSPAQLAALLPSLLGEVVLATKEPNVKTRAAAYDVLLGLAEIVEKNAAGGDAERAKALTELLVTVAAGLAGKSPHMMSASLLALARMLYSFRANSALVRFYAELYETVLTLLNHKAQEVVRATIVFIKVALSTLPLEVVRPLLPQLVPPMLTWCNNKHSHLKYQVRYLMERLVKRFGMHEMTEVTPEAHQKLLTHMRKQKERARRHVEARLAAKDGGAAAAASGGGGGGERGRHDDYEALLGEGEGYEMDDDDDDGDKGSSSKRDGGGSSMSRLALRETWRDQSEDAAGVDLLEAPLVAAPNRKTVGAKRRRGPADEEEADEAERISVNESGKLVVGAEEPTARHEPDVEMEVDPLDEVVRTGKQKRRRGIANEVAQASKAEIAEGSKYVDKNRRTLSKRPTTNFGAAFGDQYASKKGAKGDVSKPNAPQPYAYLPLNPRMLGRKNARQAGATTAKIMGKDGRKAPKGKGARRR
eukprot:1502729-Pleurochrysis_carterae.AAC.4